MPEHSRCFYVPLYNHIGRVKQKTIKLVFVASPARSIKEKEQDWLARNQNNVSEWSDMSTHGLLFQ
jgi:hypothetical protein